MKMPKHIRNGLYIDYIPHHYFFRLRFQPVHVRHPEKLCALFVRRGVLLV